METIISIATAFIFGIAALGGATVTGTKPELCKAMGGTYTPTGADQCPDGKWANLIVTTLPAKK
jgi:hypothetical protein